jgi:phosphoglycolate phosphatase
MLCAFDFDGTLADSKFAYYTAVKQYAEQNAFPLPSTHDMDMAFGNPNPPFFKGWGNPTNFQPHLDKIFLMVDDILCHDPHCMPLYNGIFEFLERLYKNNISMAIVTSRNLKPLQAVLKAHKIDMFFKAIRSAQDMIDRNYRGKPYPDKLNCVLKEFKVTPSQAIMIGDTFMDIQMAKNAGTFALGVVWGYHDKQVLMDHKADAVATSVIEAQEIIAGVWNVSFS